MASAKPSVITEQDIDRFVQEYLMNASTLRQKMFNVHQREENVRRNLFGQEQFLIISRCNLSELSLEILKRLPIYLIREFAVQVEIDSYWYWALTHDIVNHNSSIRNWNLIDSFELLMASHFAKLYVSYPLRIPALERYNTVLSEIVSQPVKELVSKSETVLMYVCYPVLEGLTKYALSTNH